GAQARSTAVVLKAREHLAVARGAAHRLLLGRARRRGSGARHGRSRLLLQPDLDRYVADQPRAGLAHGVHVEQPNASDLLLAKRVGVAEQLVSAADAEHDGPARRGGVQRLALPLQHVPSTQPLVAVLAAAEVEEVVRVRIERLAEPAAGELKADATPAAAPFEHEQVAAIRVDVHQIGIQRAHAQGRGGPGPGTLVTHEAPPRRCPCAPRWPVSAASAPGAGPPRSPPAEAVLG